MNSTNSRLIDGEESAFRMALRWSGMTMVGVAKGAGVTKSCVGNWLSGRIPPSAKTRARLWRVLGYDCQPDGTLGFLPDAWRRCVPVEGVAEEEVEAWLEFLGKSLGWSMPGSLIGRWIRLPAEVDVIEYRQADQRVAGYHVLAEQRFACLAKYFERSNVEIIPVAEVRDWIHEGARPPERVRRLLRLGGGETARSALQCLGEIDWNVWIGLMLEARHAGLSADEVRARLGLKLPGGSRDVQRKLAVPVEGQALPRTEWTNPLGQWVWVGR